MSRLRRAVITACAVLAAEMLAGAALMRAASEHAPVLCESRGVVYDRAYIPTGRLIIEPETGTSWIESESGARHYLTIGETE